MPRQFPTYRPFSEPKDNTDYTKIGRGCGKPQSEVPSVGELSYGRQTVSPPNRFTPSLSTSGRILVLASRDFSLGITFR